MNRAEYEAISNRLAAVEVRCELLENELKAAKTQSLEAAIAAEQDRVSGKTKQKGL